MESDLIKIFKSLSDQTRIDIIRELLQKKEVSCQELMSQFDLSQPTLSHHFNKLVDAGVLNERKDAKWRYYSINNKFLKNRGIDIKKIVQ